MVKFKIHSKLRALRIENGLSVKKLCAILTEFNYPISYQTIYKWESGAITPDLKSLNILADLYNVSINSFFDDDSHIQALDDSELKLISYLRTFKLFNKTVLMLVKFNQEEIDYGN